MGSNSRVIGIIVLSVLAHFFFSCEVQRVEEHNHQIREILERSEPKKPRAILVQDCNPHRKIQETLFTPPGLQTQVVRKPNLDMHALNVRNSNVLNGQADDALIKQGVDLMRSGATLVKRQQRGSTVVVSSQKSARLYTFPQLLKDKMEQARLHHQTRLLEHCEKLRNTIVTESKVRLEQAQKLLPVVLEVLQVKEVRTVVESYYHEPDYATLENEPPAIFNERQHVNV